MSAEEPAAVAATPTTVKEKSPSFHLLPNSETGHVVKDPLKVRADSVPAAPDAEADEKRPSFHLRPNSESFHVVKDPLTLK